LDASGASQPTPPDERSLAEIVTRVSENASVLVREEIELAKAEVEQKVRSIARGAIAGVVAGTFLLFSLIYLLQSAAWGINDATDSVWLGFLIVAVILIIFGAAGAALAVRSLQSGAPPTPDQAIEEARLIKEAIEHPEVQAAMTPEDGGARK
jgi:hypothetical protein